MLIIAGWDGSFFVWSCLAVLLLWWRVRSAWIRRRRKAAPGSSSASGSHSLASGAKQKRSSAGGWLWRQLGGWGTGKGDVAGGLLLSKVPSKDLDV